ncbi:MAG: hypothetical protein QNJ19_03460 [Woeseiaceae bacterium]|nr:hypothetical protein [Woeseiaceae bacterium]
MRATIIAIFFVFGVAHAESTFQFRGFGDTSSCDEVLEAEVALGASIEDTYEYDQYGTPKTQTKLTTTIFEHTAVAYLTCTNSDQFVNIDYVIGYNDPEKTEQLADFVIDVATQLFGKAHDRSTSFTGDGRVIDFYSGQSGLVRVFEGIESAADGPHNVVLMVCPNRALCSF